MPPDPDADATIPHLPPLRRQRHWIVPVLVGAVAVLLGCGGAVWWLRPVLLPSPVKPPVAAVPPRPFVPPAVVAPHSLSSPAVAPPRATAPQTAAPQTTTPPTGTPQTATPQTGTPQTAAPRSATPQAAASPTAAPLAAASPVAPPALRQATAPAASDFVLHSADAAQIRNHTGTGLTIFRFAPDPNILVLDFGSLRQQGMMLDRVAAFAEKAGAPRNRVLSDSALDAAIRAGGDTLETYYYGHDYSAQELTRFFALADADHIALNPQEAALRRLMQQQGWFKPGTQAALISIPQAGAGPRVTMEARSAILQHELSHGLYFSDPAYAAYVRHFWRTALTAEERAAFRRFLGSEEYDTKLDDLVINEMQAYLMFTRDPLFFRPGMIGMSPVRLAALQTQFAAGMPGGWLRDTLLALNGVVPLRAAAH